ncbi:hypothetical protein TA3x_004714 [Tundrisphaera sp. TA3]|uniref:hypothetical protein n=1 Tax=Tundrisphaera sp. TA3 TaxID=3435775 RepID=UPI003EBF19D2
MFASSLGPRARRRGIVLVLILGMLGLVALIGVTFATFAGQSLKSSRDFMQGVARPSAEVLMDYALAQLINDTSNPLSAIRGHSLLRDMYGNDSVFRGGDPTVSAAGAIRGHLDQVYLNGTATPLTLTGSAVSTEAPFYNQIQYTTNIPTNGQYFGLNFTRWILTFPAAPNRVAQTFEILGDNVSGGTHVFTLSNNLGNPTGAAPNYISSDTSSNIYLNPNLVETGSVVRSAPINRSVLNGTITAFPVSGFTLDAQYMRAFNGPGMTQPDYTQSTTTHPTWGAPYPKNYAAYANFRLTGLDPDAVGMDEDYDACDLENWFLAIQSADGQVIIPSFHRPGILRLADWTVMPTSDPNDVNTKSAAKILRPRQIDNSPLFPIDPTPNATGKITYDIDNDGDGITDSVWLDLGYPIQRDPGGKLYKPLFAFMVLGLNGRLPLNTAGNLQARADGVGLPESVAVAPVPPVAGPGATPVAPPRQAGIAAGPPPTLGKTVVPQAGAYDPSTTAPYPFNTGMSPFLVSETWVDAPIWDHASHLGYSVNEINPKYALQNAPANAYPASATQRQFNGLYPGGTVSVAGYYSQFDNAGVDVALTQLRNLLAGTYPTDMPTPLKTVIDTTTIRSNQDTNIVRIDGQDWVFPNNVFEPADYAWGNTSMSRSNTPVPGRWGEAGGIPSSIPAETIYSGTSMAPNFLYPIAPYLNPVRAGRSTYVYGSNDVMDDDFDSIDPYFAGVDQTGVNYPVPISPLMGTPIPVVRTLPEQIDSFDGAGQRSVASERIRAFVDPIDPAGTGRVVGYMQRPYDAHDYGLGHDKNGRVSHFRYFRPAGLPQRISYLYNNAGGVLDYNIALLSPETGTNRTQNVLHGFQQALLPGKLTADPDARAVAVMGAMPFDWKADPTATTPPTPAPPAGYDPLIAAPTVNPNYDLPLGSKINTDWGPNLGASSPAYLAVGPYAPYNATANLGTVNGYLGGSLNKDEADEMDLYTPNIYDQPFGPSDLEWLYRKHDVDGASLSSRLPSLAPISFLNQADGLTRRRLFSIDSWEPISFVYANDNPAGYMHEQVPYRGVLQPRFQWNSRFTPRASSNFYGMNQVASIEDSGGTRYPANAYLNYDPDTFFHSYLGFTHANPIATEFLPNPTLPMNPNPNNADTAGASINNYIYVKGASAALPYDTAPATPAQLIGAAGNNAATLKFVTGVFNYSALQSSAAPVQTPSLAHRDRRINLNFPLPISSDPAEPIRQKWIRETYQLLKAILPPQSVDTPEELAALSQYVVNIIDFRDPDCTSTRFVNTDIETIPATDTTHAGVRFARPADPMLRPGEKDPAFPYDPSLFELNVRPDPADPLEFRPQTRFVVQHGMEYSPVAINEVLAYSTRYDASGTDTDNNRLYIELVNTLTDHQGGNASDIDLRGWDIVVTPDAYGWGRPDPITGDVSTVKFPAVLKKTAAGDANLPPQPTAVDPMVPIQVNGGSGLPGYIFGETRPLNTLANPQVTGTPRVPAIQAGPADEAGRRFFILANEAAAGADPVGMGAGLSPAGAEVDPILPVNFTGTIPTGDHKISGLFPDYAMPFGRPATEDPTPPDATHPNQLRYGAAPAIARNAGKYFWVYLRRPANPFDTEKLTDARPNREMVVVDSMRFLFVEGSGTPAPMAPQTPGANHIFSTQRLQPYRGGHLVGALPGGNRPSPRDAYGYTEQTDSADGVSSSSDPNYGAYKNNTAAMGDPQNNLITRQIESTIGRANDAIDANWCHFPFHDRDFTSVAELLLVPGCPPGLFTKQFVEEAYPGNIGGTAFNDANPPGAAGAIVQSGNANDEGRVNFNVTAPVLPTPSFPYLPDAFYYTAASITPPDAPNAGMTKLPTEVGGRTGAGWFKMFEFFEVPSSANGAIGTAANGVDFDWYRSDVKPGLMNLNLIIDEEAFYGLIDDDRLNKNLAAGTFVSLADDYHNLPSVVTQIDANGYPDILVGTTLARYPISDLLSVSSDTTLHNRPAPVNAGTLGRGFVYRDPAASGNLIHGLKGAFHDFLKLRHGGSGYLFAFGSGAPGQGTYVPSSQVSTVLQGAGKLFTSPVASERPFRSLSFPDINYTVMRPASLPPSTYGTDATYLPSWSFPLIPTQMVGPAGPPVGGGILQYAAAAAAPFVTPYPPEAPSRLTPGVQYVADPGIKNPYLERQSSAAANLPPLQPNHGAIPPTPARRLFQIPDNQGSTPIPASSLSNASLHGAHNTAAVLPDPVYFVNQQTTDVHLTSQDTSTSPATLFPPTLVLRNRKVLMPDNQTEDQQDLSGLGYGRANYLGGLPAIGTGNTDNRQHPLYRTEWLQKVMNLTTVRTHQFAVWITVGFFEVTKTGTPEMGIADQLGVELNSAAGAKIRFRSFFVLDRTRAKGFNPYNPGDFRDVVTYRRRIE